MLNKDIRRPLVAALLLSTVMAWIMRGGHVYAQSNINPFTDRSGSITTGGTSQTLAGANLARKRIIIQNPCTTGSEGIGSTENLFINFTSAATTAGGNSIELQPCTIWDSGPAPAQVTSEAITVIAATTGHKYVAKEQ